MTVKVLVTALGQQIVAGVKQIENKDTNEIVGYWLSNPRTVQYTKDEEGNIGINFQAYCLISDENEFSLRADHVVAILEPRDSVAEGYTNLVFPPQDENLQAALEEDQEVTGLEVNDLPSDNGIDPATTEEPTSDASVADGTAGHGTESAPEAADGGVGQTETVAQPVAGTYER